MSVRGRRTGGRVVAVGLSVGVLLTSDVGTRPGVASRDAPPPLAEVWRGEAGRAHVEQAGLVRELSLVESHGGITVTLERAYADANRVVVGLTIQAPESQYGTPGLRPSQTALADAEGRTYRPTFGLPASTVSDPDTRVVAQVMSFDASPLPPGVGQMTFELSVAELVGFVADEEDVVDRQVVTSGPWRFQFDLPIVPGRVVEPGQTVTAAGVTVSLDRVVATPSETRVFFRFTPPEGEPPRPWAPAVRLDRDELTDEQRLANSVEVPRGSGAWEVRFPVPPGPSDEDTTFTVVGLVAFERAAVGQPAQQHRHDGPWTFAFRVP